MGAYFYCLVDGTECLLFRVECLAFVGGDIAVGLLDANLVTVLDVVAYPTSDILRRWIDGQYLVDILVIKGLFDNTLDMGEVSHHTILIQRFGFAIYSHHEVVSVQRLALALITQM